MQERTISRFDAIARVPLFFLQLCCGVCLLKQFSISLATVQGSSEGGGKQERNITKFDDIACVTLSSAITKFVFPTFFLQLGVTK
jgi:hypothetical protein